MVYKSLRSFYDKMLKKNVKGYDYSCKAHVNEFCFPNCYSYIKHIATQ